MGENDDDREDGNDLKGGYNVMLSEDTFGARGIEQSP